MTADLDLRPQCPRGHGAMTLRPLGQQTYEQLWTGVWYDCQHVDFGQQCRNAATTNSDASKALAEQSRKASR